MKVGRKHYVRLIMHTKELGHFHFRLRFDARALCYSADLYIESGYVKQPILVAVTDEG